MRAIIGFAIVAVHGAGFVALAAHARGHDLAVELDARLASPALALAGRVPDAIAARVAIDDRDAAAPGLAHRRWTTTYRGDFTREVGATQLVGPFQDPDHPACSARVVIGQRLLDDGLAPILAHELDAELRGLSVVGAGDYRRVRDVTLRWTRDDAAWVGDAPRGYARARATIELDRVDVPVEVALVPELRGDDVHLRVAVRAQLELGNRAAQWLSDKLGGDRLATRLARHQLDGALLTVLAPPPPFVLPGGASLRFVPCGEPPAIVDGAYAELSFGVALGRVPGAPQILPPRFGRGPRPRPDADTRVALDLDLDALDAMLFELWRAGELDRQLADAGLDRRFNAEPIVTDLLSIRLSPVRLALPPVVRATPDGLRLAADARVAIADGDAVPIVGRIFGTLAFDFGDKAMTPRVGLSQLELACEQTATTLVPCYADLVAAMRERGADFQGALTLGFGALLADVFVGRRLGDASLPAELAIHGVTPSLVRLPDNAALHLELDASFVTSR